MNLARVSLKKFWILLTILLVILVALTWVDRAQFKEVVGDITALSKLNGQYVVQGTSFGSKVLSIGWFGNHPIAAKSGTIIDYGRSAGNEYALVLSPDNRDEYLMQLGSPDQKLDTTNGLKAALAVSTDGTRIAYARLSPTGFTNVGPSTNIKDWSMAVYSPRTKSALVYPSAYAPQFFTNNDKPYLEFMSPQGVGFVDLDNNQRYVSTTTPGSTDVQRATFVTNDGTHALIYNSTEGHYSLYSISGKFPFSLTLITSLSPVYNQIVGIDLTGFYVAAHTTKSNTSTISHVLFSHPAAPEWAYTLAGALVSKLIP